MLIDTLMVDREVKYNNLFKQEIFSNADLETAEDPITRSPNENELTNKKVKAATKVLDDYDSDEERENATIMFINDL